MENINIETHRNRLMEIGIAMFSYYEGNVLDEYQVDLLSKASDREKQLGQELVVSANLKGQKYTNYCKNKRKIYRRKVQE